MRIKRLGQLITRKVDDGSNLIARHRGEVFEKIINSMAGFEIIHQILDGHPCACKYKCPAQDIY